MVRCLVDGDVVVIVVVVILFCLLVCLVDMLDWLVLLADWFADLLVDACAVALLCSADWCWLIGVRVRRVAVVV